MTATAATNPPKQRDEIGDLLAGIQRWQVEDMGNTCSICYGDNAMTQCDACGWWGRIPPENQATPQPQR